MLGKYSNKLADNRMLGMSGLFMAPDDETYGVIRVPHWGFVSNVWLEVETAYIGGTPSITVGWSGNKETAIPAGFMSRDITKPTEVGLKIAQKDNLTAFPGKYFNAGSGAITVTITAGGATTEGNFRVFCEYTIIQ